MICQCEWYGKFPTFRLEPTGEDVDMYGLIFCRECHGLYRPAHRSHRMDGTPDQCTFCQQFLREYAATEAEKI